MTESISIKELEENYFKWLKDRSTLIEKGEWNEITTPFLDIHNDYLQIYAKNEKGNFVITDGGYILSDLDFCGCAIDTDRRKELLEITLNGFGVKIDDNSNLYVEARADNYPQKKHSLIQTMLSVHDLFYTLNPRKKSIFTDDVTQWLEKKEIRYLSQATFVGRSGYNNVFDFVIPKSKMQPQRLIKTINNLTKDKACSVAFSWLDTKESRREVSEAFAFVNDNDNQNITNDALSALRNYEITPVLWSEVEKYSNILSD